MQQDLFNYANQQNDSGSFNPRKVRQEPGFITLRFEQVLLTLIGLLVLYAFVYSWGFEKGRNTEISNRSEVMRVERNMPLSPVTDGPEKKVFKEKDAIVSKAVTSKPELAQVEIQKDANITLIEKVIEEGSKKTPDGRFTIQHVTYLKEDQAKDELKKLSGLGYKPFLVPSGKYLQICINGFKSKSDAVKVLKKLKNEGTVAMDAYIRNMPAIA